MPVFGMNNGTIAIYSYNYGAGNTERLFKTLKLSLIVGVLITTAVAMSTSAGMTHIPSSTPSHRRASAGA